MTLKWLVLIVIAIIAAMLTAWVALKAINGIVYEVGVLRRFLETGE